MTHTDLVRRQAHVAGATRPGVAAVVSQPFACSWSVANATADQRTTTGGYKRNVVGMHPLPRRIEPLLT